MLDGAEHVAMKRRRTTVATPPTDGDDLFHRVVAILDQARDSVVRSVNSHMVLAYWHVGREMVQTLQFYLAYADRRSEIPHKPHGESAHALRLHKARGELASEAAIRLKPDRALLDLSMVIDSPPGHRADAQLGALVRRSIRHRGRQPYSRLRIHAAVLPGSSDSSPTAW